MMANSTATTGGSAPPSAPSAHEIINDDDTYGKTSGGSSRFFKFDGMAFTVTEGNEVALAVDGGAVRALDSESFFDAGTGTRQHFVDVQGRTEVMLLLVSVREDQRRIVNIQRFS